MRAFRYRLAAVLKRAEHAEQRLQVEVARLQEELSRTRRQMQEMARLREALRVRLRALHGGEVDLSLLQEVRRDLDRADVLFEQAARLRRSQEERMEALRERLLTAARERQRFEKHRDSLAGRHRRAELAAETKQLDEIGASRHASVRPSLRGLR